MGISFPVPGVETAFHMTLTYSWASSAVSKGRTVTAATSDGASSAGGVEQAPSATATTPHTNTRTTGPGMAFPFTEDKS